MALNSRTFKGDAALEACLIRDDAHIKQGAQGEHVAKIQAVIMLLDDVEITDAEVAAQSYGQSTASAVLNYKQKRNIINTAYQTQADDIVGKMTIQALDDELQDRQEPTSPAVRPVCKINRPFPPPDRLARLRTRQRSLG
jgi:peptidoglycan hydrolase-like protein with peptidoglycan-binding domain